MNPKQLQTLGGIAAILGLTFAAVQFLQGRQAEGSEPPPGGGGGDGGNGGGNGGGGGTLSVVNLPRLIFRAVK